MSNAGKLHHLPHPARMRVMKSDLPGPPKFEGDHFWMVATAYQVDPVVMDPKGTNVLDPRNIFTIIGPFCFHCEQVVADGLVGQPCPGEAPV